MTYREYIRQAQRSYVRSALRKTNGNVSMAAWRAGISRRTFYALMSQNEVASPLRVKRAAEGNSAWKALGG